LWVLIWRFQRRILLPNASTILLFLWTYTERSIHAYVESWSPGRHFFY
jgi:hypothetical protein